jgi:hypothetical protein
MTAFIRRSTLAVALLSAPVLAVAAASYQLLTPRSISVPGGESQQVSIRVLDAAGRPSVGESVTFTNDACGVFAGSPNPFVAAVGADANGVATIRFTASNPPGITCWINILAGFTTTVNVLTYRVSEVAMQVATVAGDAPVGQSYTLRATPSWGAYGLKNVDVSARLVSGAVNAALSNTTLNTGELGYADFTVDPAESLGDYAIEFAYRTRIRTVSVPAPSAPWQDMWWAGTGENGWGISIVQHRDMLFAVIYAYDEAGKPTWFVVPGGTWDASHAAFTGLAYVPTGTPFYAYDTSQFLVGPPVGSVKISFAGPAGATLDYTLNGHSGRKALERDLFAPAQASPLKGLGDMWWGGPAQNGWGVAVLQQYGTLFVVWFTYDASGAPTWYYMPAGNWLDDQTYAGHIYRASGSAWLGVAYDASRFKAIDAGVFRLRFSGDNASFDYTLDGRSGSIPLTRTPF